MPSLESPNKLIFVEIDDSTATASYTFNDDGTMVQVQLFILCQLQFAPHDI